MNTSPSTETFTASDVAAASLELIFTAIIPRGFQQMGDGLAPERSKTGEQMFLAHYEVVQRVIESVCVRGHLSQSDADDFSSYVTLRMVQDDYEAFKQFEGRANIKTYLSIVIRRMLLDYRVAMWGRWRASAEAKRWGPLAIKLEEMIIRDKRSFEDVYEELKTHNELTVTREELEKLAARLPPRVSKRMEPEEALAGVPAQNASADELVIEGEHKELAERVSRALRGVMATLDREERLILVLKFEDGRTVPQIAASLRLDEKTQKALYRRVNDLLLLLRKGLEAEGIDKEAVREIIDSPGLTLDWARTPPRKITMTRPSITAVPRPPADTGGKGAAGWR